MIHKLSLKWKILSSMLRLGHTIATPEFDTFLIRLLDLKYSTVKLNYSIMYNIIVYDC